MWLIILISVLAVAFYLYGKKSHKYWEERGVPYMKPFPILGNFVKNLMRKRSIAHSFEDVYYSQPDKRYVGFYQFLIPMIMIRDPKLIKKISVKEFDTFPEHATFVPEDVDPLWGKNLFAMKGGEKWHDMRSTLSPSFTSSKMRMMFGLMKDCAKQFIEHYQKQGGTITIDMKDSFTRFTNDVIATTAFGVTCDSLKDRDNEFYLMGKDASDFTGTRGLKFLMGALCPGLMKLLGIRIISSRVGEFFRGLIKNTIAIREEKGIVRPDMINLLMEARKGRLNHEDSKKIIDTGFAVVEESELDKAPARQKPEITDEDITSQAIIFFLGGFDTISSFMSFTAHELAVNPDVQEKLRKEVDEVFEDCNGDFTYEALLGMKYLDMVVTESLRKWPPTIGTDRIAVTPFTIEPELPGEKLITFEKGTSVWLPFYALHRDPKYYPNPEKFDPERFNEGNKHNIKPFTYLPFGAGPRHCIASRFALLEGKLILAEILNKFEIVPVERTKIPLELREDALVPMPKGGFWLGLKPRIISKCD